MSLPRNFTHRVIPANRTTDPSFKAMPRTGL
jgi:hypothetical protein